MQDLAEGLGPGLIRLTDAVEWDHAVLLALFLDRVWNTSTRNAAWKPARRPGRGDVGGQSPLAGTRITVPSRRGSAAP